MNAVQTGARRCPGCQKIERIVAVDEGGERMVFTISHPLTVKGCPIAPSPRQQQRNRRFLCC